jgi:hypothetical protein
MPDRLTPASRHRQLSMHSRRAVVRTPSSQDVVDPERKWRLPAASAAHPDFSSCLKIHVAKIG